MNCNYFRTKSDTYQYFELDSVLDARPLGYRAELRVSVIGEKNAFVVLSAAKNVDLASTHLLVFFFIDPKPAIFS